MSYWL